MSSVAVSHLAGAAACGYLLGTTPTADVVARLVSDGTVDLRRDGSGNPGTANAAGVLGVAPGAAVLVGDVGKAAAAGAIGRRLAGPLGAHVGATAAVIGHCHPFWRRFRGGKGVAASVGQCLVTFPAYFPIDFAVSAVTVAVPRWKQRGFATVAVSSMCWTLAGVVWWRRGWTNAWGPTPTAALPVAALTSSMVILLRFRAEARRVETAPADVVQAGSGHGDESLPVLRIG